MRAVRIALYVALATIASVRDVRAKSVDPCATKKAAVRKASVENRRATKTLFNEENAYNAKVKQLTKAVSAADERIALVKASIAKTDSRIADLEFDAQNPVRVLNAEGGWYKHDNPDKDRIESDRAEIARLQGQRSGFDAELGGLGRQHEKLLQDVNQVNQQHATDFHFNSLKQK